MATLERELPPSSSLTSSFDAFAVPGPADDMQQVLLRMQHQEQLPTERVDEYDQNLISLGDEELFTGTRTRRATIGAGVEQQQASMGTTTPVVSEELFRSLGAAKHAFLFALSGLLHQSFESSRRNSPSVPTTSSPTSLWNALSPARRHSVAAIPSHEPNPYSSTPDGEPDTLLANLVQNLRTHTLRSPTMMSSVGGSPLVRTPSAKDVLLEELQSRVESVALELPPLDAELARSLGSLLACIERLLAISRHSPSPSPSLPTVANFGSPSPNVYLTLEREARALQTAKGESSLSVMGAAREVELAERDLLWGRVDDLSERVGVLCRQRATVEESPLENSPAQSPFDETKENWYPTEAEEETDLHSELPRYSTDVNTNTHLPPAYFTDYATDSKADWAEKPPLSPELNLPAHLVDHPAPGTRTQAPRPRQRRVSVANGEKMQRDLESVSMAIERLYLVSPQLANQRVEPDRRMLRERQLAKLGNAIERLSKGRLNNQRAAASPVVSEESEEKTARIKRMHDAALDNLIEQIDKAASRTLADQRVDMNGKRKAVHRLSLADPLEVERREFILEHTGRGRLAGQDAIFHQPSHVERFPGPPDPGPVSIQEFFKADIDPESKDRPSQFPTRPVLKKRFSSKSLFGKSMEEGIPIASGSGTSGAMGKKASTLRLAAGVFKKGSTPTSSRRGSLEPAGLGLMGSGMSRTGSNSSNVYSVLLDYVCEESRNLGTVVVTFWPRLAVSHHDEYECISVETDSILVAPISGGPACRIILPSRVIPQQVSITSNGNLYEAKLITIDPSPTRARHDLEVHAPLSTAELREKLPIGFACAKCDTELVDSSNVVKYNALPSEHWAELLDAWMCHQDQQLSDDLIAKGKGIKPRENEGLVGSAYVVFDRDLTRNWLTPEKSEPQRSPADDLLFPAHCVNCSSLIGHHVTPLDTSLSTSQVRLLKYATYPIQSPATASPGKEIVRYSLASHLTAEMLEIGQAHACHRFVVEDVEEEKVRLLLWLFNPAVRLAFSTMAPLGGFLQSATSDSPTLSIGGTSMVPVSRALNVVKVFYTIITDETDLRIAEFEGNAQSSSQRIAYPLEVTERLTTLLQASTSIYPVEKRAFGEMESGFLERL